MSGSGLLEAVDVMWGVHVSHTELGKETSELLNADFLWGYGVYHSLT